MSVLESACAAGCMACGPLTPASLSRGPSARTLRVPLKLHPPFAAPGRHVAPPGGRLEPEERGAIQRAADGEAIEHDVLRHQSTGVEVVAKRDLNVTLCTMAARKTGFDKFVAEQMTRPRFSAEYARARAEIRVVDDLIRSLDERRVVIGMTKAELARRISASPEVVRRLLTAEDTNPTMETVLRMAEAVGLRLALEPVEAPRSPPGRPRPRGPVRARRRAHAAA